MPAHERELLTLREAAERIGVSPITLQKQAKKGTLRAALVRRQWLVPPDEVERYAREHKGRPGRPRREQQEAGGAGAAGETNEA